MIINLDCLLGMRTCLADNSIDAVVTDPPYGLSKEPDMMEVMKHWMNGDDYVHTGGGFMGKACMLEGFEFIGFEMDPHYCEIAEQRIAKARM